MGKKLDDDCSQAVIEIVPGNTRMLHPVHRVQFRSPGGTADLLADAVQPVHASDQQ